MPPNLFFFFIKRLFLFAAISWVAAVFPFAAQAAGKKEETPKPVALSLRVAIHPAFDRLVFDGPRGLTYEIRRDGTKVTMQFSAPATVNLGPVAKLSRAGHFTATGSGKPLAISFSVPEGAVLKDFVNGSSAIVDIFGSSSAEKTAPKEPPANQAAGKESKPAESQTEQKNQPASSSPSSGDTAASGSKSPEQTNLPASSKPEEEAKPVSEKTQETPKSESGAKPSLIASFDPQTEAGAVIFARGGKCTILFDRKITLAPEALAKNSIPAAKLEAVNYPNNTGYRFTVPGDVEVKAGRQGTAWQIFQSAKRGEITVSTGLVAQPEYALGARELLPAVNPPVPVKFTDPVVGDDLVLVPLNDTFTLSAPRRMADYILLPSAQGLVVKPLHDKVVVRAVSDGIEITAEGGLKLSPSSDTGSRSSPGKKSRTVDTGKFMFDFMTWRGKPNETFTANRQRLMQTIVDVPEAERNLAKLELARFYFAHGMGAEALSLLGLLVQQSPDLVSHPEFLALRGAVNVLAGHAQEGLKDLSDPELNGKPEIELWRAVGAAQFREWAAAEERVSLAENVLNNYPEPFYSRFWVLAIEAAVAIDKDQEAGEWLDRLESQPYLPEIEPALFYLRGVLRSKAGHADMAESLWQRVAQSNNRLYKIRAELALIDLGVATGSLKPLQAVERLEGLRYAWRGDDLEFDILHRLGSFYIEAKNFKAGLNVLGQAVHLFPNSPMTPAVRAEMAKTFHDVFLGDQGAAMSPLEALTLYQDFRDLIPTGEEGVAVGRNLAERLVAIDLLDQASSLLETQIKNLKGEEKVKTSARLAAIRLLDRKPEAALAALDMGKDDMPASGPSVEALQNEKQLLRARAYSEQKKYDEALALLQDNTSAPAKTLKADITMRAQRWKEAAQALLEMIGPPPKAGELVTPEQAQWLVNCAIAMSLDNDTEGLDRLAIDFGPAMAGTAQSDAFRVLTRPEKGGPMRDIAAAQSRITEVDMFRSFLDSYRGGSEDAKKSGGK